MKIIRQLTSCAIIVCALATPAMAQHPEALQQSQQQFEWPHPNYRLVIPPQYLTPPEPKIPSGQEALKAWAVEWRAWCNATNCWQRMHHSSDDYSSDKIIELENKITDLENQIEDLQ
jgi:hypothetical protein